LRVVALEEASHGVVWAGGVFVADEPIVHAAAFPLVEFPAEELVVEAGDLGGVGGGYFEVYEGSFFGLWTGYLGCCFNYCSAMGEHARPL